MRIGRKHLRILVVSLSVLIVSLGSSSVLYSNSVSYEPTLDQIATAKEFHLATDNVLDLSSPTNEVGISGNLFSFSHVLPAPPNGDAPGVFDTGVVRGNLINTATHDRRGRIYGSFVINKHWGNNTVELEYGGEIFISFTGHSSYVPPYEGETAENFTFGNYNFNGSFRITGGSEYYAGLTGTGTIAGTYQHHNYGDGVDFVMIGKAFAR
jgi:hypothetical protein